MKAAFWGIAVLGMGILGVLLIVLFGNITVTNQQDYTYLKNSVEAAMYDSIDKDAYENGLCVCTTSKSNGQTKLNKITDYTTKSLTKKDDICNADEKYKYCKKLIGEIKLNEEVFAESFVRRFTETVKDNKNYKITIQEIIEYPPKVSVEVKSSNKSGDTTSGSFSDMDFDISNRIDSIFEYKTN